MASSSGSDHADGDGDGNVPVVSASTLALSQYEPLRRIFSYCPTSVLHRVASVCRQWRQVAAINGHKDAARQRPAYFCHTDDPGRTASAYAAHANFQSPGHVSLYAALETFVASMWTHPRYGIVFTSDGYLENENEIWPSPERTGSLVDASYLFHRLPIACETVTMATDGVVLIAPPSMRCDKQLPPNSLHPALSVEHEGSARLMRTMVSMCLFPATPNVTIMPFSVSFHSGEDPDGDDLLERVCKDRLPAADRANIKCVLVFCNYLHSAVKNFLDKINRCTERRAAVGGGVGNFVRHSKGEGAADTDMTELLKVEGASHTPEGDQCHRMSGLIFACDDDSFSSASLLLTPSMRSKACILGRLREMRDSLDRDPAFNEANSHGFMFACCGRGRHFHKKSNFESELFHQVFPRTQLIGMFGNGEFGADCFPKTGDDQDMEDKDGPGAKRTKVNVTKEKFLHQYSTVFVVMSFRSVKKPE